jgi:hypothetical protein
MKIILSIIFVLFFASPQVHAEVYFSLARKPNSLNDSLVVGINNKKTGDELNEILAIVGDDKKIIYQYKELILARIATEQKDLNERSKVIYWTNRVSVLIFILTHVVLVIGIWAAIKEFISASKIRSTEPEPTELKLSLEGIALKTSLHGTLIFAFTIFLYFLFLKFVYPINLV